MSRYIDAEVIPKLFDEKFKETRQLIIEGETHLDNLAEGFTEADKVIRKIPTADVVEVRHGRWIYNPDGTDWGIGAWLCSLCRGKNANLGTDNTFSPYLYAGSKFCPECGAKMDGERKD